MNKFSLGGAAVVAATLLTVSTASAHVVVRPAQVGVATFQTFDTSVPNEKDTATTAIRLVIPAGLNYISPSVKPGWTIAVKKDGTGDDATVTEIDWTGGSIPVGQRDDFTFSAQVPASATTLAWKAYQTYEGGTVVSWDQTPDPSRKGDESLTPYSQTMVVNDLTASGVSMPANDNTARYIGGAALVIALLALLSAFRKSGMRP